MYKNVLQRNQSLIFNASKENQIWSVFDKTMETLWTNKRSSIYFKQSMSYIYQLLYTFLS